MNEAQKIKLNHIFFVVLLVWLSFFPQPIQDRYHFITQLFLITLFLWILARKGKSIFKKEVFPLLLFIVAIGISVFFARQRMVAFRSYIDLALPLVTIYYFISESFSSERSFTFLIKTISITSSLVALGGILESIFKCNLIYQYLINNPYYERYITGFTRPMSTLLNPAALGSYLIGSLPFNFVLFKRYHSQWRLLGAAGIILSVTTIILTFSRGAFLGLIFMAIFYLFTQKKYSAIAAFVAILLSSIFVFSFLPYPFSRFSAGWIIGPYGSSVLSGYRIERFFMTLRMLKDHPFFGLGLQHFRINFYNYFPHNYKIPYEIMIPDNMYLTILAETGIVGFAGFSVFLLFLFKDGWQKLRKLDQDNQKRWFLLICFMSLTGLLVTMCGYDFMYWINLYLFFCIIIGCFGALRLDYSA